MRISKIKIRNLYGIKECEIGGESLEFSGKNGTGKTSVLDAIRLGLTNKSERDYIVRNGETEGEIIIETDNGLTINRKPRTNHADYKSVKKNGSEVPSPESFLKDIFTPLQLNPVEFLLMDKNKQNALILDLIEFNWDINTIIEWFGEIVPDINYEQNILQVLSDIQSEKGYYFRKRQDINRDARNKKAFIEEIAENIPTGYEATKWQNASTGEVWTKVEQIRKENETIEKAKGLIENRNNKVRKFEADKEISIAALNREIDGRANQIANEIIRITEQIKALEVERDGLMDKKSDKLAVIEQTFKANIAKYDAEVNEYQEYAGKEIQDASELVEEAKTIEMMKSHLNEYHRMVNLQEEVDDLLNQSQILTDKIEKARLLPGEILETSTIPIDGLTVKDGIPLINGLPVSNLSEGEKLDLCIDVAIQKPNGLQIILIDGTEKLASELRQSLYEKCKSKGLQFIATRTTDDSELTVIEL